ncbi:MAG: LysE family transporter [Prevotella sp.]|nr:LysE family transporter [Candidatus Equicola stercoris]
MELWYNSVSVFELIIKGVAIGILASCLFGPVGVLCVQRTLNKGRWYGFATGIGASISDFIYAVITGFGLSFVTDLIEDEENMFWMKIIGAGMLFFFGIVSFRSNPIKKMTNKDHGSNGSLWHEVMTSFFITLSNPLIIFLFTAAFAMFAFVVPEHPLEVGVGYTGILLGALLWWFALTYCIDKLRHKFSQRTITKINRTMGVIVMIVALYILIGTCTDLYTLPSAY